MASLYKLTSSGSSLGLLVHDPGSSRGRSTGLTPLRFMVATHASRQIRFRVSEVEAWLARLE
jgi:hypothetical protein